MLHFGKDPRWSEHIACFSRMYGIEAVDIIEDFEDLKQLVSAENVFRNRSQNNDLFAEYRNGEIVNGDLVKV